MESLEADIDEKLECFKSLESDKQQSQKLLNQVQEKLRSEIKDYNSRVEVCQTLLSEISTANAEMKILIAEGAETSNNLRETIKEHNDSFMFSSGIKINLQEEFTSMQKHYRQQILEMEKLSVETGSQLKHLKELASSIHMDKRSNTLTNLSADIGYLKGAFDGLEKTIVGIQSHLNQLMISSNEAKTGLAVLNTGLEYTRSDLSNKLNQAAGYLQQMEMSLDSKILYLQESTRLMARHLPLLHKDLRRINY